VRQQAWIWSLGYVGFALLCGLVAMRLPGVGGRRSGKSVEWNAALVPTTDPPPNASTPQHLNTQHPIPNTQPPSPSPWLHLLWIALAACASTLLLATTNHLSQNVAAIPFLWILPLSLYLLSFIVCF